MGIELIIIVILILAVAAFAILNKEKLMEGAAPPVDAAPPVEYP
uniref:NADH dehydrogenase subunit 3 n=1 Tax=Romanomermis culicivorax TaxID=13658 RepID=A0A915KQI4_ROMCU